MGRHRRRKFREPIANGSLDLLDGSGDDHVLIRGGDVEDLRDTRAKAAIGLIRPDA
jgi:hypothetical protein